MPRIEDCGLVLFDEPSDHALGGWAAVAGEEPRRVDNVSALRNDITWVSNIDFNNYMKGGHAVQHNLRRADFFRAGIKQLAADVGIDIAGGGAYEAVQKLSTVTSRVYRLAVSHYKMSDADMFSQSFPEDIHKKLTIPDSTQNPNNLLDFMGAYQSDSTVTNGSRAFGEGMAMLSLRRNRFRYFGSLLELPLPDEAWEHLTDRMLPADHGNRLDWILDQSANKPILAECVLEPDCDADLAALAAFGTSPGRKTILRRWVAHPELVWLTKFFKITVRSAWVSRGYVDIKEKQKLPASFTRDDFMALSYSAGILVENHFQAMSMTCFNKAQSLKTVSPGAVWMKAYDRATMFTHALDMHRKGFMVTGYGMGGVRTSVSRNGGELQRLAEYAGENGFVYPPMEVILNV